jgi:hypothetical protein
MEARATRRVLLGCMIQAIAWEFPMGTDIRAGADSPTTLDALIARGAPATQVPVIAIPDFKATAGRWKRIEACPPALHAAASMVTIGAAPVIPDRATRRPVTEAHVTSRALRRKATAVVPPPSAIPGPVRLIKASHRLITPRPNRPATSGAGDTQAAATATPAVEAGIRMGVLTRSEALTKSKAPQALSSV